MPDPVPDSLKIERLGIVSELQRSIVASRQRALIGSQMEVIVDHCPDGEGEARDIEARSHSQAFEIDGSTYLSAPDLELAPGDIARATVVNADDADLWAVASERIRVARRPADYVEPLSLDLQTAWGR
jgi:tRNA A37 methylthiotransferase MiaB